MRIVTGMMTSEKTNTISIAEEKSVEMNGVIIGKIHIDYDQLG